MNPGSRIKDIEESVREEEKPKYGVFLRQLPLRATVDQVMRFGIICPETGKLRHFSTGCHLPFVERCLRGFKCTVLPSFTYLETPRGFRQNLEAEKRRDSQGTLDTCSAVFSASRNHPQ